MESRFLVVAAYFFRDSFSYQFATFCFGWVIFMEDSFNTVIVVATCTLHEVRDIVRLYREKLSFIVVGIASPIA